MSICYVKRGPTPVSRRVASTNPALVRSSAKVVSGAASRVDAARAGDARCKGRMFRRYVFGWVHELVQRNATRRWYAPLVGLLALGATLSMSIPFLPVLIAAVLLNPVRWRHIVLWSALGSASAALLLLLAFHYLGWNQIVAYFPQIETTQSWIVVSRWLEDYQLIALFVVAASPLPLIPALIFAAILAVPPVGIFVAVLAAKMLQYGVVAWLVAWFPQRFARGNGAIPLSTSAIEKRD